MMDHEQNGSLNVMRKSYTSKCLAILTENLPMLRAVAQALGGGATERHDRKRMRSAQSKIIRKRPEGWVEEGGKMEE